MIDLLRVGIETVKRFRQVAMNADDVTNKIVAESCVVQNLYNPVGVVNSLWFDESTLANVLKAADIEPFHRHHWER